MALISVIVPYYNDADVLDRCLSSLAGQSGDFEFLLVSDFSSDGSDDIVRDYAEKDGRIIPLHTEYRFGVSGARNTGIEHAGGEWITFLDADDSMNDGAFKAFTDAIIVSKGFNMIQFNHYRHYAKTGRTRLKDSNAPGKYTAKSLPKRWREVWNKLYRADFAKQSRFNLDLMFGEDELFNIDCLARDGRIYCAPGITVTHNFDGRQTLSKTKKDRDVIELVRAMLDYIEENKDPEARRLVCMSLAENWPRLFLKVLTRTD